MVLPQDKPKHLIVNQTETDECIERSGVSDDRHQGSARKRWAST
jgi:hypothetical protein